MKIPLNTGGGDARSEAVIVAVAMSAYKRNWEVYGIKNRVYGLLNTEEICRLTPEKVHGFQQRRDHSGDRTKGNPFKCP
jgi:6-phosphofructokinase